MWVVKNVLLTLFPNHMQKISISSSFQSFDAVINIFTSHWVSFIIGNSWFLSSLTSPCIWSAADTPNFFKWPCFICFQCSCCAWYHATTQEWMNSRDTVGCCCHPHHFAGLDDTATLQKKICLSVIGRSVIGCSFLNMANAGVQNSSMTTTYSSTVSNKCVPTVNHNSIKNWGVGCSGSESWCSVKDATV